MSTSISCGLAPSHVPDVAHALELVRETGLHFVVAPLSAPEPAASGGAGDGDGDLPALGAPFASAGLLLGASTAWSRHVVGRIAADLPARLSAAEPAARADAARALARQIEFAAHLALPAVLLPGVCAAVRAGASAHPRTPVASAMQCDDDDDDDADAAAGDNDRGGDGGGGGGDGGRDRSGGGRDALSAEALLNYARAVNALARTHSGMQYWVHVALAPDAPSPGPARTDQPPQQTAAAADDNAGDGDGAPPPLRLRAPDERAWLAWHAFRSACDSAGNVALALEIGQALPSEQFLKRWLGEPVRALVLPAAVFVANGAGFPVLPRKHQAFVCALLDQGAQMILTGEHTLGASPDGAAQSPAGAATSPAAAAKSPAAAASKRPADPDSAWRRLQYTGAQPYWQYLQFLDRKRRATGGGADGGDAAAAEAAFRDVLQLPLQPLFDNLESQLYETFEQDPVKYARYEEAVTAALRALKAAGHLRPAPAAAPSAGQSAAAARAAAAAGGAADALATIVVVGAGRGPLVSASIRAAAAARVRPRVVCVEKNQNALVTLAHRRAADPLWRDAAVEVVGVDMRGWAGPAAVGGDEGKADVLVSELLGSLGDNELSPECLDGAQHLLQPWGVSVPQRYTSFIAPISSQKVWLEVRKLGDATNFEKLFVVKLHNHSLLAPPQPLFEFAHPRARAAELSYNERCATLRYRSAIGGLCHGFAGYFNCELFKELSATPPRADGARAAAADGAAAAQAIVISTEPSTRSAGMGSWFEAFLPLQHPIELRAGGEVVVTVWRRVDEPARRVWYEWAVSEPIRSPVFNPNGRSYWIGL